MRQPNHEPVRNGRESWESPDLSESIGLPLPIQASGFVLAGGRSSRMGRDKALLIHNGIPLAAHVARQIAAVVPEVTVIGDPGAYAHLGFPVVSDLTESCGPLGGLFTALTIATRDWNILVACDMPYIVTSDLASLLETAGSSDAACVIPRDEAGKLHPLCAAYHRSCLPAVIGAIRNGHLKMTEVVRDLRPVFVPVAHPASLANVNTPEDWTRYANGH